MLRIQGRKLSVCICSIFPPAGMPHLPYNPSETEVATAVIARTDPNEQESVVLLPHLEK